MDAEGESVVELRDSVVKPKQADDICVDVVVKVVSDSELAGRLRLWR